MDRKPLELLQDCFTADFVNGNPSGFDGDIMSRAPSAKGRKQILSIFFSLALSLFFSNALPAWARSGHATPEIQNSAAEPSPQSPSTMIVGVPGITETVEEIMARQRAFDAQPHILQA